jgi:putative nucleotidyltransferase with HDIG domain
MRFRIPDQELPALLPKTPALHAHCRRVAALAREIAIALPLPGRAIPLLEQAALLHHNASLLFGDAALDRLLREVLPKENWPERTSHRGRVLPEDLVSLLTAFRAFPRQASDRHIWAAAEILAVANFFDEHAEFSAWDCNSFAKLPELLDDLGRLIQPCVREAMRKAFRSWSFSLDTRRLPVQIGILNDLLGILAQNGSTDVASLARLASRDPIIAATFLQAANSGLYGRRTIQSIRQAIAHIGMERSRRLLLALAVHPIFASSKLRGIWRHSLWVAEFCEGFARARKLLDPEAALFLGLVHDIGRLATQAVPQTIGALSARLSEGGCPVTYIEQLLFGSDHAELSAAILSLFRVPEHFVDAVRFHHRPAASDSVLSSLLYLGEYASGSEEDLPSTPNLFAALRTIQCSFEDLMELARGGATSFSAILHVA